jgi:hypothetical protein
MTYGYIAQWLERLTADQQVTGSNPGVPFLIADRQVPGSNLSAPFLLQTAGVRGAAFSWSLGWVFQIMTEFYPHFLATMKKGALLYSLVRPDADIPFTFDLCARRSIPR